MGKDFVPNEGSGNLFKNKFKKSDAQPDYKGECMLNGTIYEIAGWVKTIQSGDQVGQKFFSLKVNLPREKEDRREPPRPSPRDSDDLPF